MTVPAKKLSQLRLLSGDALYNSLMENIEPELTLSHIHTLQEKYKDESVHDRTLRAERYKKAFKRYDEEYALHQQAWIAAFTSYKHEALQSLEADDRERESGVMNKLEEELNI
jgi:hypothetical protein